MKTKSPNTSVLKKEIDRLKEEIIQKDRLIRRLRGQVPPENPVQNFFPETDLCNALFHLNPVWTVLSTVEEGIIVKANRAFYRTTGYREEDVVNKSSLELGIWVDPAQREIMKEQLLEKKQLFSIPLKLRLSTGDIRSFLSSAFLVEEKDRLYALSMIVEADEEDILEKAFVVRELQTEKIAEKLQELDTTIRIIADAWGHEKVAIFSRIERHIHGNIMPYIEMLKTSRKGADDNTYLHIIEENLTNLNPMYSVAVPDACESFTASENHVIQLIRQGKSSKEIAKRLNVSTKAVSFHRSNIRRKLNLVNKKISLATYLNSQSSSLWPLETDKGKSGEPR